MNRTTKYLAYTALVTSVALAGCNFFARTAQGLGRLGERMYTGAKEDVTSLINNSKRESYIDLGTKDDLSEEYAANQEKVKEARGKVVESELEETAQEE